MQDPVDELTNYVFEFYTCRVSLSCAHTHTEKYIRTHIETCTHACTHTRMHTHTRVHKGTTIDIRARAHTHTRTHTPDKYTRRLTSIASQGVGRAFVTRQNGLLVVPILQCVVVYCSVLQCVTTYYSVLQCVAVCCSVLQCVEVCCSVLQRVVVFEGCEERLSHVRMAS